MGPLRTFCGLAVAALILSGCGGGAGSSSPSTSAMSSATPGSGAAAPASLSSPAPSPSGGSSGSPPPTSGGTSGSPPPSSGSGSTGSATLQWTAPTTNSDGSALTDLAGYHIYYGTSAGSLSKVITISNPSTVTYVVTSLGAGTWYFAMDAYTNTGLKSAESNVGSKTIS